MRARFGLCVFYIFAGTACASDCSEPHAAPFDASSLDANAFGMHPPDARTRDAGPPYATLSDREKKGIRDYRAAMKRGREATRARKWVEARNAFDEARAALPGDARADAELAYAELLEGSAAPALIEATLKRARDESHDDALTAQIWFNLGLAYEKDHDDENAALAFWHANGLVPSAAAKTKLHGRTFECNIHAKRARRRGHVYEGWLAAYRGLSALDQKDPPPGVALDPPQKPPETESTALLAMCSGENAKCQGQGPFVVRVGDDDRYALHVVFVLPARKILAFDAIGGGLRVARCGMSDEVALKPGKYALATVLHAPAQMTLVSLETGDCDPANESCTASVRDCNSDAIDSCHSACFVAGWTSTVHAYDVVSQSEILTLEQSGNVSGFLADPPIPSVEPRLERGEQDEIRIVGCTESFPLAPLASPQDAALDH